MNKLELLIRKNNKKREIESCKNQLNLLLDIPINEYDFISIERTDVLVNKFFDSFKKLNNKVCEKISSTDIELGLSIKRLSMKFSDTFGFLIIKQTKTCGLLKVPIDKVLNKYVEVIDLDGDSLCLLSTNESEGIYIDYFEESSEYGSNWFYEICYWQL